MRYIMFIFCVDVSEFVGVLIERGKVYWRECGASFIQVFKEK